MRTTILTNKLLSTQTSCWRRFHFKILNHEKWNFTQSIIYLSLLDLSTEVWCTKHLKSPKDKREDGVEGPSGDSIKIGHQPGCTRHDNWREWRIVERCRIGHGRMRISSDVIISLSAIHSFIPSAEDVAEVDKHLLRAVCTKSTQSSLPASTQ